MTFENCRYFYLKNAGERVKNAHLRILCSFFSGVAHWIFLWLRYGIIFRKYETSAI